MVDEKNMEVLEGARSFNDPVTGDTYYIATPSADDVRGADWQYSKTYTKSMVEGITTSAEMIDILMRRGLIGPEFEKRQKELTDDLSRKVGDLQRTVDIDEKQQLAIEVASARDELFNWNQRLNGPMSNTCEQIADDARLEYLTARMVRDKKGANVWEDYSDFLKERNQAFAMRARFEVMLFLQGLDSNFLEQTPEAVAIREVEEEIQKKTNEVMAKLEEAVSKEPEKPKKKRSSNKKVNKKDDLDKPKE
jgi:hypothetical protein